MVAITEKKQTQKNQLFLQNHKVYLVISSFEQQWNLGLKNYKTKKIHSRLSHSDLLSGYKSNFAQMPTSQENMNVFLVRFDHNGLNRTILNSCK